MHSLYYAEACKEFVVRITSLHLGNTSAFKEMLKRWQAIGNTTSDLTGLRFELQVYRSGDERVTARPTGRYCPSHYLK